MNHLLVKNSNPHLHVSQSPLGAQPGTPHLPGNDTSHYNIPVDWANAAFTWIKASQGTGYIDHQYNNIRQQAKGRAILAGAYHFFDSSDPIAQARHFVTAAGPTDIGYALDWEQHPELVHQAIAFVNEVEKLTARVCRVYSYLSFLEGIGAAKLAPLARNPLWLADLSHNAPHIPAPWKVLEFWQYKFGKGSEPDLDVYYGTLDQLKAIR